jgi:predicted lipid-binding transport protein (Tim44 family)
MGDGSNLIGIIIFAAVAGFLVLRLRGVLGRRTGTERRREPFAPPPGTASAAEKVVPMPSRPRPAEAGPPGSLAAAIARIKEADRSFDEAGFLRGARGAFEIIVNAFAQGDLAALKPLLSPAVYASFSGAIEQRIAQHETHSTNLMSIKSIDIAEAELSNDTATVTVRVVSDQVNVTRAVDGSVVDGNPDQVEEKTDLWTFARPVRARDPNWTLVATHSP